MGPIGTGDGWAFWLATAGVALAVLLAGAVLTVPAYASGERLPAGLAAPLPILAVAVWASLHRCCATGARSARQVAWALIGILGVGAVLTAPSVGLFVAPVAALLAVAAALTPRAGLESGCS